MNNVLAFKKVLMKRNRQYRKVKKRGVIVKYSTWSGHFEEQCMERNISENMVMICLKKGRKVRQSEAAYYVLGNFYILVARLDEEMPLTAYFKAEWLDDAETA